MMRTTVFGVVTEVLGFAAAVWFAWTVSQLPGPFSRQVVLLMCPMIMTAGLIAYLARKMG